MLEKSAPSNASEARGRLASVQLHKNGRASSRYHNSPQWDASARSGPQSQWLHDCCASIAVVALNELSLNRGDGEFYVVVRAVWVPT